MTYPRIHLAIDNCFASKRWTRPDEWVRIVTDLGVTCIEASADNECDPLYADPAYLADWLDACRAACETTGARVANLYSGHGTYATLGLGHPDVRNRDHIRDDWVSVMIQNAAALDAGLGFYCHAFCQSVLEDPAAYRAATDDLYDRLATLAARAADAGLPTIGVEQMYTPHQIPWTIDGATELMREVYARGGQPLYLSLDTGHQIGQQRFLRPTAEEIVEQLATSRTTGSLEGVWLGPKSAYGLFRQAAAAPASKQASYVQRIGEQMDAYPHLFAAERDGDLYAWIDALGGWCPIFHLQQTDGATSSHWPFTDETNDRGIVHGDALLQALAACCRRPAGDGMPAHCKDIYFTIEMFAAAADYPHEILSRLEASVAYWRQFIPEDGLPLNEL